MSRTQTKVRPEDMEAAGGTRERGRRVGRGLRPPHRDRQPALAAHRRPARALPGAAAGDRLRRPTRLCRASQSAGHAAGQHRTHPGPLPGQAADRPRPRPQLGEPMNASDDRAIELERAARRREARPEGPRHPQLAARLLRRERSGSRRAGRADPVRAHPGRPARRGGDPDPARPGRGGARGTATEAVRTITFTSESLTTMVTLTPQETARSGSTAGRPRAAESGSRCCWPTDRGRRTPTTTAASSSTMCRPGWPSSPCTCRGRRGVRHRAEPDHRAVSRSAI